MTDLAFDLLAAGDAPVTLLFIHAPGLDRGSFRPFADGLADVARLMFVDLPMSGRERTAVAGPVDLDAISEAVANVARVHGGRAVVPVGHSWGAFVALGVARRLASACGVVFVAQSCSPTMGQTLIDHVTRNGDAAQQDAIARAFRGDLSTDEAFEQAWRTVLPLYLHHDDPTTRRDVFARVTFSSRAFNAFVAHGLGGMNFREELATTKLSALFIAGGSDWYERDPSGDSEAMAHAAPRGSCVTLDQSGHFPFVEQPDAFRNAIRAWLMRERLLG